MKLLRRKFLPVAASIVALVVTPNIAAAQNARPITLVVPVAAGGEVDTAARILGEKLQKAQAARRGGKPPRCRLDGRCRLRH